MFGEQLGEYAFSYPGLFNCPPCVLWDEMMETAELGVERLEGADKNSYVVNIHSNLQMCVPIP